MRNAAELEGMEGLEYLVSVPKGEKIVDMRGIAGTVYVATEQHIYIVKDSKVLEMVD